MLNASIIITIIALLSNIATLIAHYVFKKNNDYPNVDDAQKLYLFSIFTCFLYTTLILVIIIIQGIDNRLIKIFSIIWVVIGIILGIITTYYTNYSGAKPDNETEDSLNNRIKYGKIVFTINNVIMIGNIIVLLILLYFFISRHVNVRDGAAIIPNNDDLPPRYPFGQRTPSNSELELQSQAPVQPQAFDSDFATSSFQSRNLNTLPETEFEVGPGSRQNSNSVLQGPLSRENSNSVLQGPLSRQNSNSVLLQGPLSRQNSLNRFP